MTSSYKDIKERELVSFDVVSLFTSISRELALQAIPNLLEGEERNTGPTTDDYNQLFDV